MPCEQFVHAVAPETRENEPDAQLKHALAPETTEYAPTDQFAHAVASIAPYFPASHATHVTFTVR
jgi:hypothetical protein